LRSCPDAPWRSRPEEREGGSRGAVCPCAPASRVGWPTPRAGPAWGVRGRGGGRRMGSPCWLNPPSPSLSLLDRLYGWGPHPFGSAIRSCASASLGGGLGIRSSGSLRCPGVGVPSYLAGRGSLGSFPWFVPLTIWWVQCYTHSFIHRHVPEKTACMVPWLSFKLSFCVERPTDAMDGPYGLTCPMMPPRQAAHLSTPCIVGDRCACESMGMYTCYAAPY
jgi:hypothetical protein